MGADWDHMLDDVQKVLTHYVSLLGLQEWTIDIADAPPDENRMASIEITYGRRLALLSLAPDWREWKTESLCHTIIHELLHIHLDPIERPIINLEGHLSIALQAFAFQTQRDAIEHVVDYLATVLERHLPKPQESE